jgi:hypothetical protein
MTEPMAGEDAIQEREPLSNLFVGDGEYVVIHGGTFGPFRDGDVAHAWALDAFGNGGFSVHRIERPWVVTDSPNTDQPRPLIPEDTPS